MDSWAEADWLARFRKPVADRTALIITHRFTTAMQADIIHVMDRGRVIESGSHEELLAAGALRTVLTQQMRGTRNKDQGRLSDRRQAQRLKNKVQGERRKVKDSAL